MQTKLTVYFEDAFWVGLFETITDDYYETCKVFFGSEPKDYDVYKFILTNYSKLEFGRIQNTEEIKPVKKINPKRIHRQISKELNKKGISTKAQMAISAGRELNKKERKKKKSEVKKETQIEKYVQKQIKKKKKKKGH